MEYNTVTSPIWVDSSHAMISVHVVFPAIGASAVQFNASPHDYEAHGRQIYADLIAGKYGPIAEPTAG